MSKSFVVTAADASNKRLQQNTTPSTSTTVAAYLTQLDIETTPEPTTQEPTVAPTENINQTKDHPLEQVLGNPSQPVRTRRQLDTDGKMYIFALTMSQAEPKNIKESMADHAWIEAMQEELH
uniref:Gag-Pol polyprotein n=1 Tax=Tanacetum cinerariifolium TaxID=118510 RepID=A0A6L2KD20_TANCI|nr:Gag-Pol polyprotein [Tanacetum cinerariifolium]